MSPTDARTTSGAPAVELEKVTVEFRRGRRKESLLAVSELDLRVEEGEFVALLGPSGCGKSTVLRTIAGLQDTTSGTVRVLGGPSSRLVDSHRLGVAFQDSSLLPWATAWDNIALPFRIARQTPPPGRIDELLAMMGLSGFARSRPKQLSGGMRQRVSIARAMALSPEVLLLDEPFGALDAVTRRRLNLELGAIWADQKTTTVLVTHDVPEAVLLADRVVVMTGRPGSIAHIEKISDARPRGEQFSTSPEFHDVVDRLTRMLDHPEGHP
ncbi:ABC transporter ATP-binding protein [Microbacterium sp. 2MCAF23]|uniref:ABC transporter ATP-binding protein n=1 Tax=Microbacterium sp. 2MCAF23 TaxID=3232985 RepID=UPI003F953C89